MKYFTIAELCASNDAAKYKIVNNPTGEIADHMVYLVEHGLDPIRTAWGSGISINSGYRCPALNVKVGGSATSAHTTGYAADTRPSNGNMAAYQKCVLEWSKTHAFDQIIIEYPDSKHVAKWIHIGIKNAKGQQRRQVLYTTDGKSYPQFPKAWW